MTLLSENGFQLTIRITTGVLALCFLQRFKCILENKILQDISRNQVHIHSKLDSLHILYIHLPKKVVDSATIVVDVICVEGTACVELPRKYSIAQSDVIACKYSHFLSHIIIVQPTEGFDSQ